MKTIKSFVVAAFFAALIYAFYLGYTKDHAHPLSATIQVAQETFTLTIAIGGLVLIAAVTALSFKAESGTSASRRKLRFDQRLTYGLESGEDILTAQHQLAVKESIAATEKDEKYLRDVAAGKVRVNAATWARLEEQMRQRGLLKSPGASEGNLGFFHRSRRIIPAPN